MFVFHRNNAFLPQNGGRPGATKVMLVVTDGESSDGKLRDTVIEACDKQNITRFGIAVSQSNMCEQYSLDVIDRNSIVPGDLKKLAVKMYI